MRMINYKELSGTEIQYWQGDIYFWMPWGVYSLDANRLHQHRQVSEPREVQFWLLDLINGYTRSYIEMFDESFDDWEIINRFISGTGACDCVRGRMLYGREGIYSCNKKDNRFILQKMVIKGEHLNCTITYRGYI